MADVTPTIIVDNQRISPVGWSPRTGSATDEPKGREEQTFGVVDRVTISREAREKARLQPAHTEAEPPALEELAKQPPINNSPMLTYSPKQRQ